MRRFLGWLAVVIAVGFAVKFIAGTLTERQQLHLVIVVFFYWLFPLLVFAHNVQYFLIRLRAGRETGIPQRPFMAFMPSLMMAELVGGFWAWFAYFGDHGYFVIWPVIVLAGFFGLWLVKSADERWQREQGEEIVMQGMRPPPDVRGAADTRDFEDWQ